MATYLLTWNPKRYDWSELPSCVDEVKSKGFYLGRWSAGVSKRIVTGDRLFLIRLGQEPRGIVGSGWAESKVYEDEHWDDASYEAGKAARYVDVRFTALLNPDRDSILARSELGKGVFATMHWDSQASGIQMPDDVADELEDRWEGWVDESRSLPPITEASAIEGVVTETIRYVRGRSRYLRDLALKEAQGICCVCDVDFSKILNGDGVRVLQVHHREQLAASDAPRVTRLEDLAVVCANCHALIHTNPKNALSIETLKGKLKIRDEAPG